MSSQPKIELLQCEVDMDDDVSYFRLLVESESESKVSKTTESTKCIKYLTIDPGLFSIEDMCFGPSLVSLLPPFPPGNWNDGTISRDATTGLPQIHTQEVALPGVQNIWHPLLIDYLDLTIGKKLRTGIYEVSFDSPTDSRLGAIKMPVVAKFARFSWEIGYLENETTAFEWIQSEPHGQPNGQQQHGQKEDIDQGEQTATKSQNNTESIGGNENVGPRFLAHLTEHGRVIGFIMERITNARHAEPEDLAACQATLSRLHSLGIKHGDINRFNFLIIRESPPSSSTAILIDYDTARKCDDKEELRREYDDLARSLQDPSGRGGGGVLCSGDCDGGVD
ncbi:hypothetical protein L228DRAFT_237191 [Xylona heveae TC161]|uniref:Alpha-galactosidase A n=1 Tax=Xylona heveae (strain CBS 132557 / TC161) TaxID=1328760 RepID=A0A165I1Y0_XYLHT|nr:hypothetical protein L228DRAFT_237191 [Xylona heveae TC161]KZF24244.1 hypothetical protein L228DRAFT_237191 [Xylona heveae TC161]